MSIEEFVRKYGIAGVGLLVERTLCTDPSSGAYEVRVATLRSMLAELESALFTVSLAQAKVQG